MYEKEVVEEEAKVAKMKSDQKDPYDIRKQVQPSRLLVHAQANGVILLPPCCMAGGSVAGVTKHDPRLPKET